MARTAISPCPKCGTKTDAEAKFCASCGLQLGGSDTSTVGEDLRSPNQNLGPGEVILGLAFGIATIAALAAHQLGVFERKPTRTPAAAEPSSTSAAPSQSSQSVGVPARTDDDARLVQSAAERFATEFARGGLCSSVENFRSEVVSTGTMSEGLGFNGRSLPAAVVHVNYVCAIAMLGEKKNYVYRYAAAVDREFNVTRCGFWSAYADGVGEPRKEAFDRNLVDCRYSAVSQASAARPPGAVTQQVSAPSRVPPQAGNQPTYRYEPAVVTLEGELVSAAGETPDGEKVTFLALKLERAITIQGAEGDPLNSTESDVTLMQMVPGAEVMESLKTLKGKRVVVTGTLFHAHTGHHRTSVLVMPSQIRQGN